MKNKAGYIVCGLMAVIIAVGIAIMISSDKSDIKTIKIPTYNDTITNVDTVHSNDVSLK